MYSCSTKPSNDIMHPIECKRNETSVSILSTRFGLSPGDLRLYDFGNFSIATVGMQGTSTNVGELWVTYDITLLKPRLGNVTDLVDHYFLGPLTTIRSDGTGNGYFGSSPLLSAGSSFSSSITGNVLTLPPAYVGNFAMLLTYQLTTAQATAAQGLSFSSQISGLNVVQNGPYSELPTSNGVTPTGVQSTFGVTYYLTTTGGGTVAWFGGFAATSAFKSADFYVYSLPNSFTA